MVPLIHGGSCNKKCMLFFYFKHTVTKHIDSWPGSYLQIYMLYWASSKKVVWTCNITVLVETWIRFWSKSSLFNKDIHLSSKWCKNLSPTAVVVMCHKWRQSWYHESSRLSVHYLMTCFDLWLCRSGTCLWPLCVLCTQLTHSVMITYSSLRNLNCT